MRLIIPSCHKAGSGNGIDAANNGNNGGGSGAGSGGSKQQQQQHTRRRTQRRVTHNEKRYHSGTNRFSVSSFEEMFLLCFSCILTISDFVDGMSLWVVPEEKLSVQISN